MSDLTPEAVKAALEAATPGPWKVDEERDILAPDDDMEPWHVATATECCGHPFDQCLDNARLIAMSPDLARAYLAAVEDNARLQAMVAAKLREAADLAASGFHPRNILALIPEDAQAALDRVVAAEQERCAKVAEQRKGFGWDEGPAVHPYDKGYYGKPVTREDVAAKFGEDAAQAWQDARDAKARYFAAIREGGE